MAKTKYSGTWTAIITPFTNTGEIDEAALRKIIQKQIESGVTGIAVLGTTGESPTVSEEEYRKMFQIAVEETAEKIMVMAGTGSNSTKTAVEHTKLAKESGCDCCLVVCPYYNKPTAQGQKMHFLEIARVGLPIIIYNIKGRTGINMNTETLMELAQNEMIVGVKEASGDLEQIQDVLSKRPKNFTVLSGDDGLTMEVIKMGGDGVVSVASNIIPDKIAEMVEYALDGNMEEAEKINRHYQQMFSDLFIETNPLPVKYCAHKLGLCALQYRLPMCEPTEESKEKLNQTLANYNLN